MTTRTNGIRESRFRRMTKPPVECDHEWDDGYPWRTCETCDAFEEAPEPDFPAEDGE